MIRALFLCLYLVPASALGEPARTLGWADLVPEAQSLHDPLAEVPMQVRYDLGFAAKVFADARDGVIPQGSPEYRAALSVLERLAGQGFDALGMVRQVAARDAEIAARKAAYNAALAGQIVRLPGYALPLRATPDGVREFLLVPYVGACIHYPPPPPNQIVRAELATAYSFEGRYQMVWITGRLTAATSDRALDYVDGQATIESAYAMQVMAIAPYASDPSAETHLGSFSPMAKGPTLRLSRQGEAHGSTTAE